jgi:hypothetical protein
MRDGRRHQDGLAVDRAGDIICGEYRGEHQRDRQRRSGFGPAAPAAIAAAASPLARSGQAATDDAAAVERHASLSP